MSERVRSPAGASPADRLEAQLVQLALDGCGWPRILGELSRAAARTTRLVGTHGGVFASSDRAGTDLTGSRPPQVGLAADDNLAAGLDPAEVAALVDRGQHATVTCRDGLHARALPVLAGSRRIGLLLMEHPAGDHEIDLLEAAAVPVAIESALRDARARVRASRGAGFIDSLRRGDHLEEDGLARIAAYWGLDLGEPFAAVAFRCRGDAEAWTIAASWIETPVLIDGPSCWTLVAGDTDGAFRRARLRLEGIVGPDTVVAAAGPRVSGVGGAARSFALADRLLARLGPPPGEAEASYEDLGAAALLLSVPDATRAAFVRQQLGGVVDHPDLVTTLDAWVDTACHRERTAEALGIHRNSLGHRMGRAAQLLPSGALEPGTSPDLLAALAARRLDEAP